MTAIAGKITETLFASVIAALMLFFATAARAEFRTTTVELDDGAIVISGENATLAEIAQWIHALESVPGKAQALTASIKKAFPGSDVTIEIFRKGEVNFDEDKKLADMTVRGAILAGVIPPIESLDTGLAAAALNTVGFVTIDRAAFEILSDDEKERFFILTESPVVILSGTASSDRVSIRAGRVKGKVPLK